MILLTQAPLAHAGALCGTVRDAQTQSPVAAVGVFVFESGGGYTGLYGSTDTGGWYCIDPIEPGTYDLQVRVDDHETRWILGVAVSGTQTGVDLVVPASPILAVPRPNPASHRVNLEFRLPDGGLARLEVFDLRGRRVYGWEGRAAPGATAVSWNLRDRTGQPIASGIYLVRLRADRMAATRKLIVAR